MKKILICMTLGLAGFALTSCGAIVRNAADNTPVKALPLANLKMEGVVGDGKDVNMKSVDAQAAGTVKLKAAIKFGDLNPSNIPAIVGNPSALDVPVQFEKAGFDCDIKASSITATLINLKLSVKDDKLPNGISEMLQPNVIATLTRGADGTYQVKVDSSKLGLTKLKLGWNKFAPVVVLKDKATPNEATLEADLKLSEAIQGCKVNFTLSPTLKQYVRF